MHLVTRAWGAAPDRTTAAVLPWRTAAGASLLVMARDAGDPAPDGPLGHRPRLWEHEVVEWFVAGIGPAYLEVELGPHGHHLVLQLSDVRSVQATRTTLPCEWRRGAGWWAARADLDASWLPEAPLRALACHVTGPPEARRYRTCTALPGAHPDFHQPLDFEETRLRRTTPSPSTIAQVADALGLHSPDVVLAATALVGAG